MNQPRILVIGACGQIGTELTQTLRARYGRDAVLAADRHPKDAVPAAIHPYTELDVTDTDKLGLTVRSEGITQIYHLAALLSATGEKDPLMAWDINMKGLLNVLETARIEKLDRVFWPSSIAVFGASSQKYFCPQQTVTEPSTVYGISKNAGEQWCAYYHARYGVDVRSIRYPGLISYTALPGGGTTDYAVEIFYKALEEGRYTCFLKPSSMLPMMYMADAVRATLELMEAPAEAIRVRTAYNLNGLSFAPAELAREIRKHLPAFEIGYEPDFRQQIADSWPASIDDRVARADWGWAPAFGLSEITEDMLLHLQLQKISEVDDQ